MKNIVSLSITIEKRTWTSNYKTAMFAYNDGKDYPVKEDDDPLGFTTSEDTNKVRFRASGDKERVTSQAVDFIKWNAGHLNDSEDWEEIARTIFDEQ